MTELAYTMSTIAFASGKALFPAGEGGGETIAHDLLCGLAARNFSVEAYGRIEPGRVQELARALSQLGAEMSCTVDGVQSDAASIPRDAKSVVCHYTLPYPVRLISPIEAYLRHVEQRLRERQPRFILAQAEYAPYVMDAAVRSGVVPVLYVQNILDLRQFQNVQKIPLLLAPSRFTQGKLAAEHGVRAELLYPAVALERHLAADNSHEFITLINPVPVKGVVPFLQLAEAMPQRRFLAVDGWGTPRDIIQYIRSRLPNVTFMEKQVDMRAIYGKTHVLMVPSQWEEGFGRVITEAQANGIPVIASNRGGIAEALGDGGILVDDYQNPSAYAHALADVERSYDDYARRARAQAGKFTVEAAAAALETILNDYRPR